MATLTEIRAKYPEYSDLNDDALLDGLYRKHYSDMPREQFDAKVRPKPKADELTDAAGQFVRGVNRGLNAIASVPGEIVGGAADLLGFKGDRFRWSNNPVSNFMESKDAQPQTEAGRYADAIGRSLGASALPTGALLGNAARMAAAAPTTTGGAIANTVGQMVQRSPAAFVAGDAAAATGGAVGSQMAKEGGAGPTGQALAGITGAVVPGAAAYGAARMGSSSPHVARLTAQFQSPGGRAGNLSSAAPDGSPTYTPHPADAAAEQIIANQLVRAGVPIEQLQARLAQAGDAARFHSSGRAQNALAPVDLDPSLQRLAGSVARQQPEAGNTARSFIYGRQSGITPDDGAVPGIPTRPALARPQAGDGPMGQFERVRDALKRSLLIADDDFHGHAGSGFATEKSILDRAKTEANKLYGEAYKAGENINIRPAVEPVLQRWSERLADEPPAVASQIRNAIRQYMAQTGPVSNIQRFDKSKQFLDGRIEKLFQSAEGRNRYLGGVLSEFQRDMLAAVDDLPGMGAAYAKARDAYGSQMQLRDALKMGRDAFKENSEIGIDHFRQLKTAGEKKLFRLGFLESFDYHGGRMKRTADVTQSFQNPRIQQILEEIIPRTETAGGKARGVFADRPERFGRYLGNEQSMIRTRNEVLGNSKTAERLADDAALNSMQSVIDQLKQQPTLTALGIKAIERTLHRMFGFRADTANAVANKLFSTNSQIRDQILQNIGRRMGRDRMEHLSRVLEKVHRPAMQSGAGTGGSTADGEQR